jgi:hypothetical protein
MSGCQSRELTGGLLDNDGLTSSAWLGLGENSGPFSVFCESGATEQSQVLILPSGPWEEKNQRSRKGSVLLWGKPFLLACCSFTTCLLASTEKSGVPRGKTKLNFLKFVFI